MKRRTVVMRPGMRAEVAQKDVSYKGLCRIVGGGIEVTYPLSDSICFVSNDCAKLEGLPLNRAVRDQEGKIYDIYAGVVVAVHENEDGEFEDLTDEEVKLVLEKYGEAESGWKRSDIAGDAVISVSGKSEVLSEGPVVKVKYGLGGLA